MTPEQVLAQKPKVLTQKQREFYFENGYILLEKFLSDDWIERLRAATEEMVDRSRSVTASDAVWDIDKAHTREHPRLRRLSSMNDHHPTFWEYASAPSIAVAGRDRGPRRPRRQIPPLEAQLQMVEGRRRGEVAPGHSVLASHQLLAVHGRHIRLRVQRPAGAARGPAWQPQRPGGRPVQREGRVDGMPQARRGRRNRHEQGGLSGGAGRLDHHPQLPHAALLEGELVGDSAPAAAQRLLGGRRDAVHGEPAAIEVLRRHRAREAGALGLSRSAPLHAAARLVRRLHVHLCDPAGGGLEPRIGRRSRLGVE